MLQSNLFGTSSHLNFKTMANIADPYVKPLGSVALSSHGFYEFFAGSGMARIGLGSDWTCIFANDYDRSKCAAYIDNFDGHELIQGDIAELSLESFRGHAKLAWASFPCQDLSLAGSRSGLSGNRSGTFWAFWDHIKALEGTNREVPIIALENVVGLLSSNGGRDFTNLVMTLSKSYRVGAVVIDAIHWLPQSRPRLFIIAISKCIDIPKQLVRTSPRLPWHSEAIQRAYGTLPTELQVDWIWFNLPIPQPRTLSLVDLIEKDPQGVRWNTLDETSRLLSLMSHANTAKVIEASKQNREIIGTIYRRTRPKEGGGREQRAEVRFDGVSGCLRTPSGGSSRQTILVVNGDSVRSRLLSPREAARLMGLPDSYRLPRNYNDAYRLAGDGVAVPAVDWLQRHLLTPLAEVL